MIQPKLAVTINLFQAGQVGRGLIVMNPVNAIGRAGKPVNVTTKLVLVYYCPRRR